MLTSLSDTCWSKAAGKAEKKQKDAEQDHAKNEPTHSKAIVDTVPDAAASQQVCLMLVYPTTL